MQQTPITPIQLIHDIIYAVYRAAIFYIPAQVIQRGNMLDISVKNENWQVDKTDVDKLFTIHERFIAILGDDL